MGSIAESDKGVLLLAMGHENYFKMAVNLAASLKYNDPDIQIALVHDGTGYIPANLFQASIMVPTGNPIAYKTKLYELSPFQQTLYLDVDMIWLPGRNPEDLFASLQGIDFTIMNTGSGEYCIWAEAEDIRGAAGNSTDPIYMFYSELIYFEKTVRAEEYFLQVQDVYNNATITNRKFAGGMADELAYIIAALKTGTKPHQDKWCPVYWFYRNKKDAHLQPYQLQNNYYAYSIGGNQLPGYAKSHYNNLARLYAKHAGIALPYLAQDKRYFLSNRTKI